MFSVEKIQLNQLSDFVKSEKFLFLKNKPISSLRVASYLKNPNALPEDFVLYMAFDNATLVGYRTIWRDTYTLAGIEKQFGWLSGNWVAPDYRRKGVSTLLFNKVFKDWNGTLIYTNYAVNSKLLYDKTACFKQIKSLVGTRFYTRFCLGDILVNKHTVFLKLKAFLFFLDKIGNSFLDIRTSFLKQKEQKKLVNKDEVWNANIDVFLKKHKVNEFFKREEEAYRWIKSYPWIKDNEAIKKESQDYFFSVYAQEFENNYYTFYNDKKQLEAFVWLNLKDGHLKIPYSYVEEEALEDVVNFILNKSKEKRVKTIVVYNRGLEQQLIKKMFFVTKKTFYQNFFATKNIEITSQNIEIQSGDGDVVFT